MRNLYPKQYYVYIIASISGAIYIGVTSDLQKRVWEHKHDVIEGFTKKYKCHKLVYAEICDDMEQAISREKQIKGGSRAKKVKLIESQNPDWFDLYDDLD